MNNDSYRQLAKTTAVYPEARTGSLAELMYLALGLAGEAGEVANKVKKLYRDGDRDREKLVSELGDVLWYLTRLCDEIGMTIDGISDQNAIKLLGRQRRGTICGYGEDR